MKKVISLLSDIEEKASRILEGTSKDKERLHEQFEVDINLLETQLKDDTKQKLDKIKFSINQSLEEEKTQLIDDCNKHLAKIEKDFTDNHNALVDKVFCSIIGV